MLVEGFFFFFGCSFRGKEERGGRRGSSYVDFMLCFFIHSFRSFLCFRFILFLSFCFCRFVSFRFVVSKKKKNNNKCRSCTLISFIHFSTLLSHVFGIKISTCKRRAFRKDIFDSFQNQTDPCASLQASNGSGVPKSQFPVLSRFYVTQ